MDIIKDGVLKNFMLSQYGANKTGFTRAKNLGCNFAVQPGDESHDEIIGRLTEESLTVFQAVCPV